MITSRTLLPPNAGGLLYFIEGSPPAARPVGGLSVMVYTRRPGGTRDEQGFSPVPGTARARFAARDHPGQEAGEPCRVRADRPPGPSGTRGKVPGPYIDMTPVMRDPEGGFYNVAFLRTMYQGPRRLGLHMSPRHNWQIQRKYEARGRPTPVAIIVSHHPAFYLGALNVSAFGVD